MSRTWKHRLIAVVLGLAAAATVAGARSMQDAKEIINHRHLALDKGAQYLKGIGDTNSIKVWTDLVDMQDNRLSGGLSDADFQYLLGVLRSDADQTVIARAVVILESQSRQEHLDADRLDICRLEAKRLFQHKDWIVRGTAFWWAGELGDKTAILGLSENVRTESNPDARKLAERALLKLQ